MKYVSYGGSKLQLIYSLTASQIDYKSMYVYYNVTTGALTYKTASTSEKSLGTSSVKFDNPQSLTSANFLSVSNGAAVAYNTTDGTWSATLNIVPSYDASTGKVTCRLSAYYNLNNKNSYVKANGWKLYYVPTDALT